MRIELMRASRALAALSRDSHHESPLVIITQCLSILHQLQKACLEAFGRALEKTGGS